MFLPPSGTLVHYALCGECGYCFAPEMCAWPLEKFEALIYNADYVKVDPDYVSLRPKGSAHMLRGMFPNLPSTVRHLDYGGGSGIMSDLLREAGWTSRSYDPFVHKDTQPAQLGKFDFITAFEVFEHVPDARQLIGTLGSLLEDGGMLLFSTLLSDGQVHPGQRPGWWYASPRNGHISLFSRKALAVLAVEYGYNFGSFNENLHIMCKAAPAWAGHLL
ncbi:class I SAM-dependent methyltransferase [Noviherbaspirillum sp. 17J57-3]|uniref:Class I SAM-dependent methyltransferase n=2 Tax=Noviherbaspirillum galbum TaxID=2709383 RepID=A0A6B3SIZ7_9BURK|nr:class I SAM-dependent methyltransferase [Noviherbaspirillum galbum]